MKEFKVSLQGIGFENFRLFSANTYFDLSPITILVGPNGSGKSTLIKGLEFLSLNAKAGNFPGKLKSEFPEITVTSFDHIKARDTESNHISFTISARTWHDDGERLLAAIFSRSLISFEYYIDKEQNLAELTKLLVTPKGSSEPIISIEKEIKKLSYNVTFNILLYKGFHSLLSDLSEEIIKIYAELYSSDLSDKAWVEKIKIILENENLNEEMNDRSFYAFMVVLDVHYLLKEINAADGLTNIESRIENLLESLSDHIEQNKKGLSFSTALLSSSKIVLTLAGINNFIDRFIWNYLVDFLEAFKNHIATDFELVNNNRNDVKRYYTQSDNYYLPRKIYSKQFKRDEAIQLLSILGIGSDIEVKKIEGEFMKIILTQNDGKKFDLADLGYGISQLIPIIIDPDSFDPTYGSRLPRIWMISEPEANLHPKLQSKLADLFVYKVKDTYSSFIIETHSEYLIRKLQYLVANGDVQNDRVQIYYFYSPEELPENENRIKKINISSNGILSDEFGTGFFDESDKIALSLFFLNQSQKN